MAKHKTDPDATVTAQTGVQYPDGTVIWADDSGQVDSLRSPESIAYQVADENGQPLAASPQGQRGFPELKADWQTAVQALHVAADATQAGPVLVTRQVTTLVYATEVVQKAKPVRLTPVAPPVNGVAGFADVDLEDFR